jgi:hypothetical protein
VTTGALTANGPITATAGLTVSGGFSIPGASLTLNDLCANAVDVSGTLRVGTGTVGNNLVISTTDASTSYIRQTDVSNGKIIFGSSAIPHGAATLTVQDDGLNGSVLIKGRGTTLGGGLFIAGGDGDVSGGAVTGIITMSTNNGNEKFYLGANGNLPVWKSLELSSTTVTANLPLIAPNIGTALGTTTVAGTLVAPNIGTALGTTTVAGTLVANTIGTGDDITVNSLLYANKGIKVGDPNASTSQYLQIYGTNPGSCYIRPTGGVTPILQLGSSPTYFDTISISESPRLVTVNTNTIVTGDLQANGKLKAGTVTVDAVFNNIKIGSTTTLDSGGLGASAITVSNVNTGYINLNSLTPTVSTFYPNALVRIFSLPVPGFPGVTNKINISSATSLTVRFGPSVNTTSLEGIFPYVFTNTGTITFTLYIENSSSAIIDIPSLSNGQSVGVFLVIYSSTIINKVAYSYF